MRAFISAELNPEQSRRLSERKIEVMAFPLIKTAPLPFNAEEVLEFSPEYILFSSKNGAKHFFSRVSPEDFTHSSVIAVGSSTAEVLKSYGLNSIIPKTFSAEGIVELLESFQVEGRKFLIVRPEKARKKVAEYLKSRGAKIKEVVVYRTEPDFEKRERLKEVVDRKPEVYAFTSPSNFNAFIALIGEKALEYLKAVKVIPIGHVTQKALEKRGVPVWKLPSRYTLDGIIDVILRGLR